MITNKATASNLLFVHECKDKAEGGRKMSKTASIPSKEIWREAFVLAIAGGFGFWVANFAISLTPIAAEYRAALSISYVPMLLEALLGGLIIGFCVSYCLLRYFDKLPTENPVLKSVILSLIALLLVTLLIELPAKFLKTTPDAVRYFLIGALFNTFRLLTLGSMIGYLYGKRNE